MCFAHFGFLFTFLDIFIDDCLQITWWPHPGGVKGVKLGPVKRFMPFYNKECHELCI